MFKKFNRIIISIGLTVMMLFSSVSINADTSLVNLELSGSDNPAIYPNSSYLTELKLQVSGDAVNVEGAYILIEVNHDEIINEGFNLPSIGESYTFDKKNGKAYLRIDLKPLKGGTDFEFTVPFKIDSKDASFPEGYKTIINAKIYDSDDNLITEAVEEGSFTTKYNKHQIKKKVNNSTDDGQLVYRGEKDDPAIVTYTFDLEYYQSGTIYRGWFRSYEEIELIDILPEGAHFDPEINPGWEMIDDNTVKYALNVGDRSVHQRWFEEEINNLELHLTYPGEVPESVTNSIEAYFHQYNKDFNADKYGVLEESHFSKDAIKHYFSFESSGILYKKAGSRANRESEEYIINNQIQDHTGGKKDPRTWYFAFRNVESSVIENLIVEDYKVDGEISLDDRMKYTHLDLTQEFKKNNIKSVVKYVDENGNYEELTSQDGIYDLNGALGFKVEFYKVKPTDRVLFSATSKIKNIEDVSYDKENEENNLLKNTATFTWYRGDQKKSYETSDGFRLVHSDQKIKLSKMNNNSSRFYANGEVVSMWLRIFYKDLDSERVFENFRVVDLLPTGLDPVEADYSVSSTMNTIKRYQKAGTYNYEVVNNYENSGRTAYVFNFGDITINELKDLYPQVGGDETDPFIAIPVQFLANNMSNIYENRVNEFYLLYDGDQVRNAGPSLLDIYDFKKNGDLNELIPGDNSAYKYVSESSFISQKYIRRKGTDAWSTNASTKLGEEVEYKLHIENNTSIEVDELVLYDKFPHVNDQYIVSNQSGEYLNRGSDFSNTLIGPIEDLDGYFDIYYTTQDPQVDSNVFINDDSNWVSEDELKNDFSNVTAFKAVLKEDKKLSKGDSVDLHFMMKAPTRVDSFDDKGVNTFAYSKNGEQLLESSAAKNYVYQEKTDITVVKNWVGGPTDKPEVNIVLNRDGEIYKEVTLNSETGYEYTFTDLDVTDNEGVEYEYTVDEIDVPDNYEKSVDGYTITNTYVSPKTDITVVKKWVGGPTDKPEVNIVLNRDGEVYKEVTLNSETGYEYTFTDLDVTDNEGVEYEYTVDEIDVPENYEKSVDGYTITNTYVSPKTDITVEKKWVGGPTDKPEVNIVLNRDGEIYKEVTLNSETGYEYTFTDLDVTDNEGVEYEYTVDEIDVPENYEKSVDGYTITNTYVSPKTDITVVKEWVGGPSDKPEVNIVLNRDGEIYKEVTLNSETGYEYTFTDLAVTDNEGVEYEYTVDEVDVPENYEKSVDGYTITNTYVATNGKKEIDPTLPSTGQGDIRYVAFVFYLLALLTLVINRRNRLD